MEVCFRVSDRGRSGMYSMERFVENAIVVGVRSQREGNAKECGRPWVVCNH